VKVSPDFNYLNSLEKQMLPVAESIGSLAQHLSHKKVVLIGEATHGTHEFYQYRAQITQELIQNHNFNIVAIEADWPDTYQINNYIKGFQSFNSEVEAFSGFKRFPSWMWRNKEVLEFVTWLKSYNESSISSQEKVGFYGIDLYSLFSSIEAVIQYLKSIDPKAAQRALERYSCFDHYNKEGQDYGLATHYGLKEDCQEEVISQLIELEQQNYNNLASSNIENREAFFSALQNARTIKSAEVYYRAMFKTPVLSWNIRDQHMFEVLTHLIHYFNSHLSVPPKAIVWAHNSHIGNAAATESKLRHELNIGQLVKERYGDDAFLLGFTTYKGTVIAAREWDSPAEQREVKRALAGSWEDLFHQLSLPEFLLLLDNSETQTILRDMEPKLQRAIGVIYRPETERQSHYFYSHISSQFDGLIHIDQTSALSPIDTVSIKDEEPPETFPSSF
jgi:erythromycin esterase-like protein